MRLSPTSWVLRASVGRPIGTSCVLAVLMLVLGCGQPLRLRTDSHVTLTAPPITGATPLREMAMHGDPCAGTKVAVIDVDGLLLNTDMVGLYSQGENPVALFREKLDRASADPCVCAVVLRINSYGGGVTASDMMWHDLAAFRGRTQLPVVACLMDVATGGAYYLATGADQVFAHPTTVTGGMGVILNLYNLQDTMAQFNVRGTPIKAGPNIDLGSPVRAMDDSQKKILQDTANEFHARFREVVRQTRPEHDPGRNEDFDGRIFTAQQAMERGLVDRIGYLDEAIATAQQMAGVAGARAVFYHRNSDPARSLYSITPNVPIQTNLFPLSIPGFERSKLPTFLYLWQPEPTMERLAGR